MKKPENSFNQNSAKRKNQLSRRALLKFGAAGLTALAAKETAFGQNRFAATVSHNTAARQNFRAEMREIPASQKFTVERDMQNSPDKRGWYYQSIGVADTPEGLICTFRKTDAHAGVIGNIWMCRSIDKGRTWKDHRQIARADMWNEGGLFVAPQLSKLRDGRLVIVADFGTRVAQQNYPLLSQWQKPDRGMSNHLFWSADNGKTWTGPTRVDDVGGEPGYIVELSDGTLVFTRTESRDTDEIWNPPQPWGNNYYRNVAVFSDDRGKTWNRTAIVTDEPLQGDCETGIVELAPNRLMAMTRIGLGSGQFGQPSRFVFSDDNGKTWGGQTLTPIYGQRTIVRKLQSGNLLATYRNAWGTPGSYACVWGANEKLPYQPTSFIWDESVCRIKNGTMTIASREGRETGAIFALYPAQAPNSRVEIEAELRVEQAEKNGCTISAGCFVRFLPNRVELADRPADGFAVDAAKFHRYRLVRENGKILIFVDGELKLERPLEKLETRLVHFGNRLIPGWFGALESPKGLSNDAPPKPRILENAALTEWRSLAAKVENREDHSIDWRWTAANGFPDQFRRDRMVRLDRNASFVAGHSGYSGWTQMPDGTIVICDYNSGYPAVPIPYARAYVTTEKELTG